MSEFELKVGSRVKVKKSSAYKYVQPWRGRFERGREGTIIHGPASNIRGWLVEWDSRNPKYPYDWRFTMNSEDLIVVGHKDDRP